MPWATNVCVMINKRTLSDLPGIAPRRPSVSGWSGPAHRPARSAIGIPWQPKPALRWALPREADVRILRNGRPFHETAARSGTVDAIPGEVYRLEAYLTPVGERRPWVITNPVYVRPVQVEGNAAGKQQSATVGPFRKET